VGEHLFDYLWSVRTTAEEIVTVARLQLTEEQTERLVVWIARRVDRPQALAGDREPLERLRHVVTHWLSDGQRSALLAWLSRRIALALPPVPDAPMRPRRQPPGTAPTR